MNKKTILLRAPLLTQSGYGVHSRQVAKWLFDYAEKNNNIEVHTELLNWGQTPWITNVYAYDGLIGKIAQASSYRLPKYDLTIQLQLPNEWCPDLGKKNIGITAGVEADKVNPKWIEYVNSMDLVIVPSEFTKTGFSNTGITKTNIVVIPESYIEEIDDLEKIEPLNIPLETSFNFLVFGQFTSQVAEEDRKNLGYTIKWLHEEFANDEDVGIILKTNFGRNSILDKQMGSNVLTKLLDQVSVTKNPKLYFLHGEMTNKEIVGLYKNPTVKSLVSLSCGEGFGLPILEAAAAEVPIISTTYSAPNEYLKLGKYIKIDHMIRPVPQGRIDGQIFVNGSNWSFADEKDFKNKIRKFYKSSSIPKEWAKDLSKKIKNNYNSKKISEMYTLTLKDYLI